VDPQELPIPKEGLLLMHFIVVSDQDRSRELLPNGFGALAISAASTETSGRCHLLALIECFADELEKLSVGNQDHVRVGDSAIFAASHECPAPTRATARAPRLQARHGAGAVCARWREIQELAGPTPGCLVPCCCVRHWEPAHSRSYIDAVAA
jgi:hypothetical protein